MPVRQNLPLQILKIRVAIRSILCLQGLHSAVDLGDVSCWLLVKSKRRPNLCRKHLFRASGARRILRHSFLSAGLVSFVLVSFVGSDPRFRLDSLDVDVSQRIEIHLNSAMIGKARKAPVAQRGSLQVEFRLRSVGVHRQVQRRV